MKNSDYREENTQKNTDTSQSKKAPTEAVQSSTEHSKQRNRRKKDSTKETIKKIRKEGGVTTLKVIATALTAITMAIISAKLTGFINSLLLVGMVSIGTAFLSEVYRVILSVTSIKAKEVLKVNADGTTDSFQVISEEELEAYKNNDTKKIRQIEESRTQTKPILIEEDEETGKGFFWLFKRAFKKNGFFRIVILFAGISIITITATYFISKSIESDVIYNNTTVEQQIKEEISEKRKQEIIDEAIQSIIDSEELSITADGIVQEAINSAMINDENLQNHISLEFSKLQQKQDSLELLLNSSEEKRALLETQIKELEEKIKTLEESKTESLPTV